MAAVNVRGLRELNRVIAATSKEAKRELNKELRLVAEPIRADAQALAASRIPRIGPKWSAMRVGVTQRAVYVAPRQKGVRARGLDLRRRPKFATLMEERAMAPALRHNEPLIVERVDVLFRNISRDWNAV